MFKDVRDRWIVCYFGLNFLDIHINLYRSRFLYRIIYFPDIKPLSYFIQPLKTASSDLVMLSRLIILL